MPSSLGNFRSNFCCTSIIVYKVFPTSCIHSFYFVNFTCRENYCLSLWNWTPADQIDTQLRRVTPLGQKKRERLKARTSAKCPFSQRHNVKNSHLNDAPQMLRINGYLFVLWFWKSTFHGKNKWRTFRRLKKSLIYNWKMELRHG